MFTITRRQALAASGGFLTSLLAPRRFASAAAGGTLNIAYNVNLPSFDPNTGPSSVNPTLQSIYRSVFNNYIGQRPDLSFEPALLTAWGWNEDKTKVWMDVREDVFWHDGSRLTPDESFGRSSATPSRTAAIRYRSSGPASTISRSTASASPPTS
jgi:peptide/nickel transport system substrate-binding protein